MSSNNDRTVWTRDKILARVRELDDGDMGWYQDIQLGNGLSTKTRQVWGEDLDHPKRRWGYIDAAVPTDMTGLSVLDVGCNAGYASFQAADRGATDIVGVDLKQGYIDQANFCADVRGQAIDFRVGSVYDVVDSAELSISSSSSDCCTTVGTSSTPSRRCRRPALRRSCANLRSIPTTADPLDPSHPAIEVRRPGRRR